MTAKELAVKLNLSAAAVSMALNNKPGVSDEKRKIIQEAALKYNVNFTKHKNRGEYNETVCFILYKRQGAVVGDTPFFAQLQEGIEAGCKATGCKLRVSYIYRTDDIEKHIGELQRSICDGIILLATEMAEEDYRQFMKIKIPMVILDAYFDTVAHDCVLINNIQGAYLATDYLISCTKKQPGYLHSSYPIPNFKERADGFYKAIRYNGMSTSKSIVHHLTPSADGAYMDMLEIIENGDDIADCYFADNDWIAIGAVKALQSKGILVPEDVSVIGFDNIPSAAYIDPPLTTINVPKHYMGEVAIRRLVEIMRSSNSPAVKIAVNTSLTIRKSIKPTVVLQN